MNILMTSYMFLFPMALRGDPPKPRMLLLDGFIVLASFVEVSGTWETWETWGAHRKLLAEATDNIYEYMVNIWETY